MGKRGVPMEFHATRRLTVKQPSGAAKFRNACRELSARLIETRGDGASGVERVCFRVER